MPILANGNFQHHPPKLNPDFVRALWRNSTEGSCNHGGDRDDETDPCFGPAVDMDCARCVFKMSGVLYLNAYCETQGRGGPEEGGWWFDVGEPLASVPVRTVEECLTAYEQLWATCQGANNGYGKYSAAGGSDLGICLETHFARYYPETRPHYE